MKNVTIADNTILIGFHIYSEIVFDFFPSLKKWLRNSNLGHPTPARLEKSDEINSKGEEDFFTNHLTQFIFT